MTSPHPEPPVAFERLLGPLLPAVDRDQVLADMAELYALRRRTRSRGAANRWYAVQAGRLVLSLRGDRLRRRWRAAREERVEKRIMTSLGTDIRQAVRQLRAAPVFSIGVISLLACGIGTATAMFAIVSGVLLAPLPYADAGRLVLLGERAGEREISVAYPNFADWQARSQVFVRMAALQYASYTMRSDGRSHNLRTYRVTAPFFEVLDVGPHLGRTFRPEEHAPGGPPVIVISHATWQTAFAGDAGILGRSLTLDDGAYTVIGVMPPQFDFFIDAGAWIPLGPRVPGTELEDRRAHPGIRVVGRLAEGLDIADAATEMDAIARQLAREHPVTNADAGVTIVGLREYFVGDVRGALSAISGGMLALLLIGGLNAAGLVGARLSGRAREFGLRAALGAGPWRLARQLFIEGLTYSTLGCVTGLALAQALIRAVVVFDSGSLPRVELVRIDAGVVLFAAGLSLAGGLAFAAVALLHPLLRRPSAVLGSAARQGTPASALRSRLVLVTGQIVLSVVLLTGGGLMLRTLFGLMAIDPGFEPAGVMTLSVRPPDTGNRADRVAFYERLIEGFEALPGVTSAAVVNPLPLGGADRQNRFWIEGRPYAGRADLVPLDYTVVGGRYFETLRIPILQGRSFDRRDTVAPRVAIVDQTFVDLFWPGRHPIGLTIQSGGPDGGNPRLTVIGVAGPIRHYGLAERPKPQVYLPHRLSPLTGTILVRGQSVERMGPTLRAALHEVDPDVPVVSTAAFGELVSRSIARERFATFVLVLFAALALGLAVVGLYASVAYDVAQRRHEIGVRLALGAPGADVFRATFHRTLVVVSLGVGGGLLGSFWAAGLVEGLLFGVTSTDAATYVAVALVVAGACLAGGAVPSLRATRVAPLEALRTD